MKEANVKHTFSNMILILSNITLFSSMMNGGEICYEYSPCNYTLLHEYAGSKSERPDPRQYRLIMVHPQKLDRLNSHTFVLLKKKTGTIVDYNTMECYPFRGTTGGYECQGECDSGHVIVGEDARLRSNHGIGFGETIDSSEGTWDLQWLRPGTLMMPHRLICPPSVAKKSRHHVDVDEQYAGEHEKYALEPYKNVCYSQKDMRYVSGKIQPLYVDCEISKVPCDEMGMQRFGQYQSEQGARLALLRCQRSTPK